MVSARPMSDWVEGGKWKASRGKLRTVQAVGLCSRTCVHPRDSCERAHLALEVWSLVQLKSWR